MANNEVLKDSGSMREFSTGAHRDNAIGKGRTDLLPMEVVSMVMFNDPVFKSVGEFMEDRDPKHLIDAIQHSVETVHRFHYLSIFNELEADGIEIRGINSSDPTELKKAMMTSCLAHMMIEASKQYEAGAIKYQPNNWQLGMAVNIYIDSGMRHYLKTLRGDIDEPHYRGFIWNLLCAVWTCQHKPELNFKEEPKNSNKNKES